jgi:DNA-binding NtrC family response regulator
VHSLFSRRFDESRSALLVSTDQFVSTIVEDALYEWRYGLHVVPDPTRALQELHLHRPEIVILDLESLDLLDSELGDIITKSLAESSARIIHIEPRHRLKNKRFNNCRPHALLQKPFDCMLLRKSLEPDWQPPRTASPATCIPMTMRKFSTVGRLVEMPSLVRSQADADRNQAHPSRKAPATCRATLAFKKRSA